VSRATLVLVVAVGAAIAGLAIASSSNRLRGSDSPTEEAVAAKPQTADLDWREVTGYPGEQLVFTVKSLAVTKSGWKANIGIENKTKVGWELIPGFIPDGTFGVALFETGETSELNERNRRGTLPAVRSATTYDPELPKVLEPKASWEGRISAPGSLAAGSWARVVFGTLLATGKPPEGFHDRLVWITDSAHQLEG
jgi:hypothetical protein